MTRNPSAAPDRWAIRGLLALAVSFAGDASAGTPTGRRVDESLYPKGYGILADERLMYPVDMADWPVRITTERQLFVDDTLIATRESLTRQLHQPKRHPANPVLRMREKPWEQSFGHSAFVLRDAKTGAFRMWYNLRHFVPAENGITYRGPTCYATSPDGIHWTKPDLGVFKFGPDTQNNITLPQGTIDGLFYEPKDSDSSRRYKALVWHDPRDQAAYAPREGFYLYVSPDGIHWQRDRQRCIVPNGQGGNFPAELCNGVGDTTHFRWDSKLGKYIANVKILFRKPSTLRTVGYCESDDLIHWTRPRMAMHRDGLDEPDTQMYEHITFPYESMWIGLPRLMHTERTGWKQVEVELSCSRDGRHWTRACRGQRFLPLGGKDAWDSDYLIPGRPGAPLLIDGELRFYYWGARRTDKRDGTKDVRWSMHIGVATLRRDGFVSLNAGDKPGRLVTRPLALPGKALFVNADVSDGGWVKAAVLSVDREPLASYGLADSTALTKGTTRRRMTWRQASEVKCAGSEHVRLAFELQRAKLYAFWIE